MSCHDVFLSVACYCPWCRGVWCRVVLCVVLCVVGRVVWDVLCTVHGEGCVVPVRGVWCVVYSVWCALRVACRLARSAVYGVRCALFMVCGVWRVAWGV